MRKTLIYLITSIVIAQFSCNKKDKQQETSVATTAKEDSIAEPDQSTGESSNIVYLEGLYATSTLSLKDNSIENLFDENPSNSWITKAGAGPDEGFMLYFQDPLFIKSVNLKGAHGPALSDIVTVIIYVNGQMHGNWKIDKPIEINDKVKSLYIRIENTKNIKRNPDDDGDVLTVETFDRRLSTGFLGLGILGENNEKIKVISPAKIAGTVNASSILNPSIAYSPDQLFDSRKEFVWAEGAPGSGENETLTFKFNEEVEMDAIQIWNGFQRSEKHFTSNARIKSFEFGPVGNTTHYLVEDIQDAQKIELKQKEKGKEFILIVKEVYPGKTYKDLVLSELRFYNKSTPFLIATSDKERIAESMIAQAKGTVLEKVLDNRIKNSIQDGEEGFNKSFILRSDYTFVLYDDEFHDSENKETIADGSWELIDLKTSKAKIRIFGKLIDLSETNDYYKGSTSSSYLRIFQDFVFIENDSIRGEKFLSPFIIDLPDTN